MSIYDKEREKLGFKKNGVSRGPKKTTSVYDKERIELGLKAGVVIKNKSMPERKTTAIPKTTAPLINLHKDAKKPDSKFTSSFKKLLGYSDALQKPIETGITLGLNKLGESIGGTVGGYLRGKLFNESSMETQQKNEALQNLDAEIERGVNPTFRTGADIAGTVLGMASPVNAAYKLTGNLAAKGLSRLPIKGKAIERLVKGGAAGLGYSTAREAVDVADDLVSGRELDPVSERAKNIGLETALFGGGDLLAYGVGAGFQKLVLPSVKRVLSKFNGNVDDAAIKVADDIGVKWENMNEAQRAKIVELVKKNMEPAARTGLQLEKPVQNFTLGRQPIQEIGPMRKFTVSGKNVAQAEKAMQEGFETAQNYVQHNDILAAYPPGTTIKEAYADIQKNTGVDLFKLVDDYEKAVANNPLKNRGGFEKVRLANVAGVKQPPRLVKREAPLEFKTKIPRPFEPVRDLPPSDLKFSQLPTNKQINTNTLQPALRLTLPKAQKANTLNKSVLPLNGQVSTKPLRQPLESATGPKERQFAQNVRESNVATGEIKQNLDKNKLTYEPITNVETLDKAKRIVDADVENAKNLFSSSSGGVTADDVALGEALITKAIKDGNSSEANRLIADLAEKLTTAGQAVQAASIFKRLTPEGMLLYAQRVVNNANKALKQRLGKKAPVVKLTEEDSKFILDSMNKVLQLPDGRQKDIEMAKIMQLIANKEPATRSEKIQGIQRVAMLLNPKTMVRNTLGNTIFSVIDNASNVIATPIDKLTGKFTGNRTTTLPSLTGQLKSGLRGVKETIEDARLGVDTYSSGTQYELPSKRIFDTNALNKLDVATRTGLQLGDRPFYKAAYDDALRQQMKLAKTKEPTQDMINQAHAVAQQRTYQDTNAFVDAFRKAQTALNKAGSFVGVGSEKFGLGNVVIPFTKTPANILARAVEYSPVGLQKAIAEATKIGKGTFNQKAFVDSIARSVTGTALIMVGYDLAKKGMITGSSNKDKDVSTFERNLGKNDFAFKVEDKYYTYDWAQPVSMALAVGADIYLKGKDRKEAENVVFDAIRSGGETLFKQSIMQGLQRFMGGYSPIDNLASTAVNAPTQFIPTISKQITQLTDPNSRNVYSTTTPGTALNIAKSKIPGLSKTLEPKVDTFGNDVLNYQGNNSIFNIFFNPGFSTEFKPNETQKEIIRLYDTTGDKDIFPKVAPTSFTYKGEKYTLEPEEITSFQRSMGKITEEGFNRIISDPRYSGLSEEGKAKVLAKQIDMAYDKAKQQFLATKLK